MGTGASKGTSNAAEAWVPQRSLTWTEVRDHAAKHEAWIVLRGVVYDLIDFVDQHPGGSSVLHEYSGGTAKLDRGVHQAVARAQKIMTSLARDVEKCL